MATSIEGKIAMSREYPTLKGTVEKVQKNARITFGFVTDAEPLNGYQGSVPTIVFVEEDTLDGAPMKEGMRIAFDVRPNGGSHPGRFEACNVMELHTA